MNENKKDLEEIIAILAGVSAGINLTADYFLDDEYRRIPRATFHGALSGYEETINRVIRMLDE